MKRNIAVFEREFLKKFSLQRLQKPKKKEDLLPKLLLQNRSLYFLGFWGSHVGLREGV